MKIAIIGAGAIGSALGQVLQTKKANKISFFDSNPDNNMGGGTLEVAVSAADFVFLCLPSFVVPSALSAARPFLKKNSVVISVSKGVENKTGATIDKLLTKMLPARQPFAVLFGPMLAGELSAGRRGYAVTAGRLGAAVKTSRLFSGTKLNVSASDDLTGVALLGALKNIYSVGLGMISDAGDNVRGAYVSAVCREMMSVLKHLGGRSETALDFCGLGDLVATGYNVGSRNWQVGHALATSGRSFHSSEGARAAVSICRRIGKKCPRYPVLDAVNAVVLGRGNAEKVIKAIV